MSQRAKHRDGLAPSLFPFLAVLLCTMGALVLILMLSVSGAQSATQQVVSEMEEQFELEEAKIELVKRGLTEKLEEARIEIEKKRLALQHLEEHIRELIQEMEELEQQAELAKSAQNSEDPPDSEREALISDLERQLAEVTKELQQKLEDPDGNKPIFAIIPYDGPNRTHRRPIYLECNDRGVVIQPEGIVVSTSDLRPPYGPGNPLDAALRAIRSEFPSKSGSVTSNPYPLLIVRPSGIKHYMMARAAMSGWDDQFGYELVSEELELAYPASLPNLPNKIAQALELARQRQAALIMAMPQHYADSRPLSGQWELEETNRTGGESLQGSSSAGAGTEQFGSGLSGLSPSQTADKGFSSAITSGFLASGQPSGVMDQNFSSRNDSVDGQHSGAGTMPGVASSTYSTSGLGAPDSILGGPSDTRSPGSSTADNSQSFGAGDMADDNSPAGLAATSPDGAGSSNGSMSTGNGSAAGHAGHQVNSSQQSNPSQGNPSQNSLQQNSPAGNAGGSSNLMTSGNQPIPSISIPNSDPSNQSVPGSISLEFSNSPAERTMPVAAARGANWAWDNAGRTQTAVVRAIRMQCHVDRWTLLPEKGSGAKPEIIDFAGTPIERAERLAAAIRKRVQSWGVALAGGHWTPVLHVDVAADADWRFNQLQRLMDSSGIEVVRKDTFQPTSP